MKAEIFSKFFLCLLLSLSVAISAFGQAGRGKARVGGVVTDEAGNPIKSAKIVLQFVESSKAKFETTTDNKGEWAILGLGTGKCQVTASADGYIPVVVDYYVRQLTINKKITLALKKAPASAKGAIEDETTFELLDKGNQLFGEKKYDEALGAYEQFLEKNPNAYQIRLSIGNCYREKGEYEKAIEQYNIVLEKTSKDDPKGKEIAAKTMAAFGELYLKKQDFENAQKYFKQSIEANPNDEVIAYNVGEIYFSNQKLDEAIQYYALAIQIKPNWSDPYYKLGLVYLNKSDFEKAKEYLKKFLTLEPDTERSASVKNILDYLEKIKK